MFNTDLLWYLLIPLTLSVGTVLFFHKRSPWMDKHQLVGTCAVGLLISSIILFGAFAMGKGIKTSDTQILNGQITGKTREHGHYLRPYECNCTTTQVCSGSGSNRSCHSQRRCQTCYEDRYTVTWECQSTIGPFRIEHLDRGSRSVYNTPDPARYSIIEKGDPASRRNNYTNYIKAVPNSLFRPAQKSLREKFADMIPEYPDRVYDIYRVNRAVSAGIDPPNAKAWNDGLSEMLKTLGPSHQVNAVIVFAKTNDPNYYYALQDAWVNGKKNDVVLIIGVEDFNKSPAWVNVMALTKESIFQIQLADRIKSLDKITPETVLPVLENTIRTSYKRRSMKDFKYLEAEIDPPTWVMIVSIIIIILAYAGFWYYVLTHNSNRYYNSYGIPKFSHRRR